MRDMRAYVCKSVHMRARASTRTDEDVSRLDVAVHLFGGVQVQQAQENLPAHVRHHVLR